MTEVSRVDWVKAISAVETSLKLRHRDEPGRRNTSICEGLYRGRAARTTSLIARFPAPRGSQIASRSPLRPPPHSPDPALCRSNGKLGFPRRLPPSPRFLPVFFLSGSPPPASIEKRPERTGLRVSGTFFRFHFFPAQNFSLRIHGKYHPGRRPVGRRRQRQNHRFSHRSTPISSSAPRAAITPATRSSSATKNTSSTSSPAASCGRTKSASSATAWSSIPSRWSAEIETACARRASRSARDNLLISDCAHLVLPYHRHAR